MRRILSGLIMATVLVSARAETKRCVSGIYPHLAMFNDEGECGTGAVVPWADRLWAITYGPHKPTGSSDKLYEITPDLQQIIRPESVGGTPANRLIHRESQQLFIGPYAIDAQRNVRVIPYSQMFGRLTGSARHLTDPAGKVYYATMEEGIYEVDVKSLGVTELYADEQIKKGRHANLPGYHGKGLYFGQGRLIYANNGEHGDAALTHPEIPSGCLAEWDGSNWRVVRRNQFTDVTGPGGITGSERPATDPVWSIGWDYRSLILMLLDGGQWHTYRLPKASHCYDGAHGWNTEWPRIREIGENDLLMTMHGMFWRFPKAFCATNSAGIAPRSTYLKVIGDFCRWNDRIVFGCDDTAKNEFLNKRKAKGDLIPPGCSQSNLWFVEPSRLDEFGPAIGRGAVWCNEPVKANEPSDPFLFTGFERRGVHLASDVPVTFTFEVDERGNGHWKKLREVEVRGYRWVEFPEVEKGAWVRVHLNRDCAKATAFFQFSNADRRSPAVAGKDVPGGALHAGKTLRYGGYEMDADLKLRRVDDTQVVPVKSNALVADAASVVYVDDAGRRWRLPKGELGDGRVDREVCTERDLFNCAGTFYELPADNAGGFAKIRPICTHTRRIKDYCSYRGLLVMSGIDGTVRSDDGKATLWVGTVDDLWKFGKSRGTGGPWKDTAVKAGQPSDPYLMTGFDRKTLTLSANRACAVQVEVDVTGEGMWCEYKAFELKAGKTAHYEFPSAFGAYWVRVVASESCRATAQLVYE